MAQSPYDPAFSTLDQYRFAGGQGIANPGAPSIDNTANPYATMSAEMVSNLAMNAGKEYMAPEGTWNEELQKWVYTKKPYSSMFGEYTIPEDALWSDQVNVLLKQKEIKDLKEKEATIKAQNKQMNYQRDQTFDQNVNSRTGVMTPMTYTADEQKVLDDRADSIFEQRFGKEIKVEKELNLVESANQALIESKPIISVLEDGERNADQSKNYTQLMTELYPENEWLIRDAEDDTSISGFSNLTSNLSESNNKHDAFEYVRERLNAGMGESELMLSVNAEGQDDMMDEIVHWMGDANNIIPIWNETGSPAWRYFNANPNDWQDFKMNPVTWYFNSLKDGKLEGFELETGIMSDITWDDWFSENKTDGKYEIKTLSEEE